MMKEIKDFDGYFVSSDGTVWCNLGKGYRGKNSKRERVKPYPLKPRETKNGYMRVYMRQTSTNKRVDRYIHRLVAEAFIPNPDELPVVNHKDENPLNNHVSNLEWCTQKYNINYGTAKQRAAQKIKKPVYCVELDKTFESGKAAAEELGITAQGICVVCGNPFRMAGGYHWEYAR
jgi:hypothetical protein